MAKAYLYKADIENVLWVHDFAAYVHTLSTLVGSAATAKFDPDTTANDLYAVEFQLTNVHASSSDTLSIYVDPNGGTAITDPSFPILSAATLTAGQTYDVGGSTFLGPYIILGTHSIVTDGVTGGIIVISWRIKHVADGVAFSGSQASRT